MKCIDDSGLGRVGVGEKPRAKTAYRSTISERQLFQLPPDPYWNIWVNEVFLISILQGALRLVQITLSLRLTSCQMDISWSPLNQFPIFYPFLTEHRGAALFLWAGGGGGGGSDALFLLFRSPYWVKYSFVPSFIQCHAVHGGHMMKKRGTMPRSCIA